MIESKLSPQYKNLDTTAKPDISRLVDGENVLEIKTSES